MKNTYNISPFILSSLLHGFFLGLVILAVLKSSSTKTKVNFDVIQVFRPATETLMAVKKSQLKPVESVKSKSKSKSVFGISRQAILSSSPISDLESPAIKNGNTLAQKMDDQTLSPSDDDQLPIPVDDFMISSMPKIETEFRINYPLEAKKNNIEGPVVMDLLIDSSGVVRQVIIISGPGYGLNEAAAEALKKFKFKPAQMNKEFVAVKIRYTYKFILENR